MINEKRLSQYFLNLVSIDSVSRCEGGMARYIKSQLESLGKEVIEVIIDNTGQKLQSETGNLIAKLKGGMKGVPPLLFNAHLDTVQPGKGVEVEFLDGTFRSKGDTILGADDKSAIAIMLEILNVLREESISHGDLEIVFTVCEEVGLLGSKNLDYSLLMAPYGYTLDVSSTSSIVNKAPAANRVRFKVHGLEAHAGVCPEAGINAIAVASDAISKIKLGRIDEETTANIGIIKGGMAINIIPNLVEIEGEVRSHSQKKLDHYTGHMQKTFEIAAGACQRDTSKGTLPYVETSVERDYPMMVVDHDHPVVKLASKAAQKLGKALETKSTGGGSDANIFNSKGITTVLLGTGMQEVHTTKEYIKLKDMVESAQLILEIIKEHSLTQRASL